MLDDIIEVVLELVLDGAIEAAGSKKVPMPIRILAAGIVLVIALGLIGLLFWVGMDSGSTGLMILAVVLLAFSYMESVSCSMSSSKCCFLTCI